SRDERRRLGRTCARQMDQEVLLGPQCDLGLGPDGEGALVGDHEASARARRVVVKPTATTVSAPAGIHHSQWTGVRLARTWTIASPTHRPQKAPLALARVSVASRNTPRMGP